MKAVSLLLVLWASCLVTLAGGQPKAPLKCSVVCRGFTSKIVEKRIVSYRETEPTCRKKAIIFTTLKSVEICADPDAEEVKKIMQKLDEKKAAMSPLPRDPASPEEPGGFQKHIGLTKVAPTQAPAPASLSQGTGTTVSKRIHAPAAGTEVSSKSPPGRQDPTQLPAGSAPMTQEEAARSEVTSEAKRESLNSPASSATAAAGVDSSQPTPHPTGPVHGFYNTLGSTEEPVGHTVNAMADVQHMTSPNSNSDLMATTKGSDQPVLSTKGSLDPPSARANTPNTASSSSRPDLPSTWGSVETTTVPETAPETTSASTLSSITAIDKGASVHTNKVVGTSTDAFGTRTFDYSSPVGKQEPSDTVVFTRQAFSGQARAQMNTVRPNNLPLPSFLSKSQMHFVIPAAVVGGLMTCSVALVWLYLKFGVKPEETSREMIQGLLYQQAAHQDNVYPMEAI